MSNWECQGSTEVDSSGINRRPTSAPKSKYEKGPRPGTADQLRAALDGQLTANLFHWLRSGGRADASQRPWDRLSSLPTHPGIRGRRSLHSTASPDVLDLGCRASSVSCRSGHDPMRGMTLQFPENRPRITAEVDDGIGDLVLEIRLSPYTSSSFSMGGTQAQTPPVAQPGQQ